MPEKVRHHFAKADNFANGICFLVLENFQNWGLSEFACPERIWNRRCDTKHTYLSIHITQDKRGNEHTFLISPQKTYSRLSLSRIQRDSLKHFEISVPRHFRVERVSKTII